MKTVYILGAGFSIEAGALAQNEIVASAFGLWRENEFNFDRNKFMRFESFLRDQLNLSERQFMEVPIEDIFTPLDRCLSENSRYRGLSIPNIIEVRRSIFYVIGKTIKLILNRRRQDKRYIDQFAEYVVRESEKRKGKRYRDEDPISVITTNWDILLDNSLHQIINDRYRPGEAVVDYCCYISSLEKGDESVKPGLEVLGGGGFTTKLLKLHGSLNWLQCSRCMRLYAKFGEKFIDDEGDHFCRHCNDNFPEENGNHPISSNLIMPTYIKDLSNPQYKIIWQNAGVEISEADKLVFIGYSLPNADFEMRQLLSRMTRKNARIEIVDLCSQDDTRKRGGIETRWETFFGSRSVKFYFEGARRYIESLAQNLSENAENTSKGRQKGAVRSRTGKRRSLSITK